MSDPETVTEQSPLLGRDRQERHIDSSAATISKAPNESAAIGLARQNINESDVERGDIQATDDDLEALRKANVVKYILPVIAIGVRILDRSMTDTYKLIYTDTARFSRPVDCIRH